MFTLDTLFAALPWILGYLGLYANGAAILPFLLASSSLRLRAEAERISLAGFDPGPMLAMGFALWVPPAVLQPWGSWAVALAAVAAPVFWLGCRLRVEVTREGTLVVRKLAYVLPWSWRRYPQPPSAFTDGWGDFADPLSLYLQLGDGTRQLELGWQGQRSPSVDDLAATLNEAFARLRSPPPSDSGSPPT